MLLLVVSENLLNSILLPKLTFFPRTQPGSRFEFLKPSFPLKAPFKYHMMPPVGEEVSNTVILVLYRGKKR